MAVELIRAPIIPYKIVSSYTPRRASLNLVKLDNLTISRDIASKAAYETSLTKALENKKFWDELLEKLRKSGGGGAGGFRKIDKILTSLMFANFLSNKAIHAMLKNFNMEFLKVLSDNILKQTTNLTQGTIGKIIHNVATYTLNVTATIFSNIVKILHLPGAVKNIFRTINSLTNQLTLLAGILSFQLNKLKEVLEEDLKELIKKLDVKEKIKGLLTFLMGTDLNRI